MCETFMTIANAVAPWSWVPFAYINYRQTRTIKRLIEMNSELLNNCKEMGDLNGRIINAVRTQYDYEL